MSIDEVVRYEDVITRMLFTDVCITFSFVFYFAALQGVSHGGRVVITGC